jgi:hypothetical protein
MDLTMSGDTKFLIHHAGGDAAHSMWAHIHEYVPSNNIAFMDADPVVLTYWRSKGHQVFLEGKETVPPDYMWLPTHEDVRYFDLVTYNGHSVKARHCRDKAGSLFTVRDHCPSVKTPETLFENAVIRGRKSSGMKDTQFIDVGTHIITEKKDFQMEFVVDCNTYTGKMYPRITHKLRNGHDTYCTLIGTKHDLWEELDEVVTEILSACQYAGVCNIQLGYIPHDGFYFIESADRMSGSAWLNLMVDNNLMYDGPDNLYWDGITVSTNGADAYCT